MRTGLCRICRRPGRSYRRPSFPLPEGTVCRLSSSFSTTTIPVIDLSPFVDPHASESSKKQCAEAVHHAAVNVGFLYVKNHGVDPSITDGARAHARAFFSLPQVRAPRKEGEREGGREGG
ncbi:iron ascorbate oxidoreductase, partial [Nannochloropsis gaditana]